MKRPRIQPGRTDFTAEDARRAIAQAHSQLRCNECGRPYPPSSFAEPEPPVEEPSWGVRVSDIAALREMAGGAPLNPECLLRVANEAERLLRWKHLTEAEPSTLERFQLSEAMQPIVQVWRERVQALEEELRGYKEGGEGSP